MQKQVGAGTSGHLLEPISTTHWLTHAIARAFTKRGLVEVRL